MTDKERKLEELLTEALSAAHTQLAGMGRGKEPSERLSDVTKRAVALLGYDPIAKHDRHAESEAEIEQLRGELRARQGKVAHDR